MRRSAIWSYQSQLTENNNALHRSATQKTPFFSTSTSFFQSRPFWVQPGLTVNVPDDVYEKEADAVADAVMRMSNPQLQRQEEEVMMKPQCPADFMVDFTLLFPHNRRNCPKQQSFRKPGHKCNGKVGIGISGPE